MKNCVTFDCFQSLQCIRVVLSGIAGRTQGGKVLICLTVEGAYFLTSIYHFSIRPGLP